jgi:ABC-type dipeptide/oligopeptide/nickel transport system permease component
MVFVVVNIATDLVIAFLDPRIRISQRGAA